MQDQVLKLNPFASQIREIHDDVRRKIVLSKERCKAHTNVRRCFVVFEGGEWLWFVYDLSGFLRVLTKNFIPRM